MPHHEPLRVALIGTARRSYGLYAPLLKALPDVALVAVWGRSPASEAGGGDKGGRKEGDCLVLPSAGGRYATADAGVERRPTQRMREPARQVVHTRKLGAEPWRRCARAQRSGQPGQSFAEAARGRWRRSSAAPQHVRSEPD